MGKNGQIPLQLNGKGKNKWINSGISSVKGFNNYLNKWINSGISSVKGFNNYLNKLKRLVVIAIQSFSNIRE